MQVQGTCQEQFIEIKKIFQQSFDSGEESGAAFSIIQNSNVLINLFGGTKDEKEAWDENTIVNTFSLSKGIYAACISKLISENLLDIEKPIAYYWKSFEQDNKKNILVRHLLSHQSGMYRFKTKLNNKDLLDWKKIITILENQEPDHKPGEFTYYHAKTHGYLVGNLIKIITGMTIGEYVKKNISEKYKINFHFGLNNLELNNVANLGDDLSKSVEKSSNQTLNAFNNPAHDLNFYNSQEWRKAEIPSMGGHGNAYSIAYIYDCLANDMKENKNLISDQATLRNNLVDASSKIDLSLNLPIRWTNLGFILRGGWMFGKNKEAFGHNGWGGSLGFADPICGIGIAYVTKKINPTMGLDKRAVNLIKKFYELIN
jgi:CubicO group peptidase (beta-lactamase class C family)